MKKVLIIEENKTMGQMMSFYLEEMEYHVDWYVNGESALHKLTHYKPDIIIFNLILPDLNRHELIIEIQKHYQGPMIIISNKRNTSDVVQALEAGVDDFLYVPFNMRELKARIEAVLRRGMTNMVSPLPGSNHQTTQLEKKKGTVYLDNQLITLTDLEFKLLCFFRKNPNRVISRETLIRHLNYERKREQSINQLIFNLRKKIERNPKLPNRITTVRGIGYQWNDLSF
ncbi:response regulator transcription factor [Alkalihalobacterium sp. APHAB7]|uniref:response regulator transcription factor n=1 Tax=Alkalihalobacterium sp. APHAB7 TaxID=3402081 RepID=UPI003AAE18A2